MESLPSDRAAESKRRRPAVREYTMMTLENGEAVIGWAVENKQREDGSDSAYHN